MRACLIIFLAIMLSLNAAYAAGAGICDAMEQAQDSISHIGHHLHGHDDDNGTGQAHFHDHAHPGFSFLLPGAIDVTPPTGRSPRIAVPTDAFDSAPPSLPFHPPRAILA